LGFAGVIGLVGNVPSYRIGSGTVAPLAPSKASSSDVTTGTDDAKFMTAAAFQASNKNVTYLNFKVVALGTDVATGTNIIGAFEIPFSGVITEVGAYVDTAGVTGLQTVDIHLNGTTIMTTNKITIDSGEVSSRTAATAPTLTTTAVTAGDLITFDVDGVQTTAAKGLTIRMSIRRN
jgi:hypothetical protein